MVSLQIMNNTARKLLPVKLKVLIAKLLSNEVTGWFISAIYGNAIPHRGAKIYTDSNRIRRRTVSDIFFGIYERAEIDQVISYLNPALDVIELGGSIGVNSLHIRHCLAKKQKLLVVEADPELVKVLRYNFKMNVAEENVMILNKAIDYSGNESVPFAVNESSLSGHVATAACGESASIINVQATSLGKIIKEYGFDDYALVSDIEGMEIPIFIEDQAALKNCKQIFLEIDGVSYNNTDYNVDDVINIICGQGFKIVDRYFNCVVFSK